MATRSVQSSEQLLELYSSDGMSYNEQKQKERGK